MLQEAFAQVLGNVPGALAGDDPEYLHQLRVGTRRLRAALRVFRTTLHRGDRRALARVLRLLAAASGPARDWDVSVPRLPLSLRREAERRQRAAHSLWRRALGRFRLGSLPRGRPRAEAPLLPFARELLESLDRKALRRGTRIQWERSVQRHRLRIRLRRLRYACEFLGGAFPRSPAEPMVESLKALQDLLGELNDLEVLRGKLRDLGARGARRAGHARERVLLRALPAAWLRFTRAPRFWKLGSDPNFRLIGV